MHTLGLDGNYTFKDSPWRRQYLQQPYEWNRDIEEHLVVYHRTFTHQVWMEWWSVIRSTQCVLFAKQHRVLSKLDFLDAPDEFWLINLQASLKHIVGDSEWSWNLNARNLFNVQYRRYTSLLRYYADEPGRDIQLSLSTDF